MLNRTFNHSSIKRYITTFGNIFNEIYLNRYDAQGNVVQTIPVPIKYGPRDKWLAQLADPTQTKPVAVQLPIIAFHMKTFEYDQVRKLNPMNRVNTVTQDRSRKNTHYQGVPYKLGMEVYIIAKYREDANQIIEQILPYFTPSYSNTIKLITDVDAKYDIKIKLQSVEPDEEYDGDFLKTSKTIWTLKFTMDVVFIGPVENKGVIKKVIVNFAGDNANTYINERLVITPGLTADGQPTSDKGQTIPYTQINADDDYGYIEEYFTYNDGNKKESDDT